MDSTGSIVQSGIGRLLSKPITTTSDNLSGEHAALPTVLLLEDDPAEVERVTLCLNSAGYRTLSVSDGDSACNLVQRRTVAIVLLNWALLERLGGSSLLDDLREQSPRSYLPMIVISTDHNELMEASRLGIDDYLPNPFHPDDLRHVVDEYCR